MRSVTEFPVHKLTDGFKTKTALAAEGKTPEEIQTALGEKYKYEGDKLKHFLNAMEVANTNLERLYRVLIVSFAEGEAAPAKAVKIEEHHYIPEFGNDPKPINKVKAAPGGGQQKKKNSGPKESPWGLSPEQKLAKKGAGKKDAKPAAE